MLGMCARCLAYLVRRLADEILCARWCRLAGAQRAQTSKGERC